MKLLFTSPDFDGQSCELVPGRTTVGRGPQNTLVIQDNSVSMDHCEILIHGSEIIFREHGSSNGTWIDGTRVGGQLSAHNGQTVRFGAVEARLEVPPETDDGRTDITAVHLHARVLRDEARARAAKPDPSPAVIRPNHAGALS